MSGVKDTAPWGPADWAVAFVALAFVVRVGVLVAIYLAGFVMRAASSAFTLGKGPRADTPAQVNEGNH